MAKTFSKENIWNMIMIFFILYFAISLYGHIQYTMNDRCSSCGKYFNELTMIKSHQLEIRIE